MIKSILSYFDFRYYVKFALLFVAMYYFYTIVIGITTPGGTYYPFFDHYLNFTVLIRDGVLLGAQFINWIFGIQTHINGDTLTDGDGFKMVRMGWPCYGLMIKSFWLAYVLAHASSLKKKIIWSLSGILCIFILNCIRVGMMMVSMEKNWTIAESFNTNNHDLFNYFSYGILIILIILYNKQDKNKTVVV
jgi:exosortase/archaeosortase family protein